MTAASIGPVTVQDKATCMARIVGTRGRCALAVVDMSCWTLKRRFSTLTNAQAWVTGMFSKVLA